MRITATRASKCKLINFDDVTNENKIKHNPKWTYILDHPSRILKIAGSGFGKINALLTLICMKYFCNVTA